MNSVFVWEWLFFLAVKNLKHLKDTMPACFLILLLLLASYVYGQNYFPVPPLPDNKFVSNTGHTMQLLQTTKPGSQVRILVYGQSISMQDWWQEVKKFLQKQYPGVTILMENRAIGGFSTERLKWMVDNDVISFYPDLILLHVYGNQPDYEHIIQTIRSRTTADIALQTDHIGVGQNQQWHDTHAMEWMPALCKKYNLALIDIRAVWKSYLQQNRLAPAALLSDHVHLNAHGNYLMAEIIKNYFRTALPLKGNFGQLRILKAPADFTTDTGKLTVPIHGNRVDIVWNNNVSASQQDIQIRLNSQNPGILSDCYYHTRPGLQAAPYFLTHIGQLLNLQLAGQPREEQWQLTVTAVDSLQQQIRFRLKGLLTGEDGTGSSDTIFTSRSGLVVILPEHWFRRKHAGDFKHLGWVKPGDVFVWQVKSMCHDRIKPLPGGITTLVQGIAAGQYRMELTGKAISAIKEIHIYTPPLAK